MGLVLLTPPDDEPITTSEAIEHLRLDEDTTEDTLVQSLVLAARERAEHETGRALLTQTWRCTLDAFPCRRRLASRGSSAMDAIELPRSPVQSVSAIKYVDQAGTLQPWAADQYQVDTTELVARIWPAYGVAWPITRYQMAAVQVDFVAGYGQAVDVPEGLKQAMKLMIGTWYDHRESVITGTIVAELPMSVNALLGQYRVPGFARGGD